MMIKKMGERTTGPFPIYMIDMTDWSFEKIPNVKDKILGIYPPVMSLKNLL